MSSKDEEARVRKCRTCSGPIDSKPYHPGNRLQRKMRPNAGPRVQLATIGIRTASPIYFEAALIIGVLGFVSSVALAKFLMRAR